jgi:aspartate/glutamate racemase
MREIQGGRKVALIATHQIVEARTYQQYIGRNGEEIIHSRLIQETVNTLIANVKAGTASE